MWASVRALYSAFKSSLLTPQPGGPLEAPFLSVIRLSNLVQRIKNHCSPRRFPTTRSGPSAQVIVQVTLTVFVLFSILHFVPKPPQLCRGF